MIGVIKITGTTFQNFRGLDLIHNRGDGTNADYNFEPLTAPTTVTFTGNTIDACVGKISFHGMSSSYITTVTITGNTFHNYATIDSSDSNKIDSAVMVT